MKNVKYSLFLALYLVVNYQIYSQNNISNNETLKSVENLLQKKEPDKAINLLMPLLKNENPVLITKTNRLLGHAYLNKRDFIKAISFLGESLKLSKLLNNNYELIHSLYLLGKVNAFEGDFEKALLNGEKSLAMARVLNLKDLEYKISNLLSWAYFSTNTDFNKILIHYKYLHKLVDERNNLNDKAFVYNNIGYDLTISGTVPLDSAIYIMEFANSTFAKEAKNNGRWYSLMNLTWQHRLKNELKRSKKYGELSLKQGQKINDRHAIIEASFQLGETFLEMGKIKEAEKYYLIGLEQRGDKNDRDGYVFDIYYSNFLWQKQNRNEAISILEKAVEFLKDGEVFYEMHGRALLSSFYLKSKNVKAALTHLEKIENPRNNYFSFESKFIASLVRAELLTNNGNKLYAKALLNSWQQNLKFNGAKLLETRLINSMKRLNLL